MTTILRTDPFRGALSLRNAMNQLFEQIFVRPTLKHIRVTGSQSQLEMAQPVTH
jgi:hypothetical protein